MHRLALALAVFWPALLHAQAALQLVGRDPGSVVRPGETVIVALSGTGTYTSVFVGGDDPLKAMQLLTAPPYQFSLQIPGDIVAGKCQLRAMGCRRAGDCAEEIAPVTIDVEPVWPESADGSRLVKDAPGVTVDMGGNPVMHRSAIAYPPEALAKWIGGTLVLEITPDWEGHVEGIQVLSGPEELRKDVIKQLLQWHLPRRAGQKPRQVTIAFDAAEATRSPAPAPLPPSMAPFLPYPSSSPSFWNLARHQPAYTFMGVMAFGLSQEAHTELLNRMAIQPGQEVTTESMARAGNVVHNFDSDLSLGLLRLNSEALAITITPPGFWLPDMEASMQRAAPRTEQKPPSPQFTPQRIQVAAAAQSARLISKVDPEYPFLAKANHIQGVVRMRVLVREDGRVAWVYVQSGHALLVHAAEDAVQQWRYSPTFVNGKAVEVLTDVEVEFFLAN